VKYWAEDAWREAFSSIPNPEAIAKAAESDSPNAAVILCGFISLVGSQSKINDALEDSEGGEDQSDLTRFRELIRGIFEWRIGFSSRTVFRRYEQVRELLIEQASVEFPRAERNRLSLELSEKFDDVFGLTTA